MTRGRRRFCGTATNCRCGCLLSPRCGPPRGRFGEVAGTAVYRARTAGTEARCPRSRCRGRRAPCRGCLAASSRSSRHPSPSGPSRPRSSPGCCPAVMLLGSVGFVALGPRDPSSLLFGGMFALSTVGMLLVGGGGRSAGQRQAVVDEERRDYLRYLATTRRRVRVVVTEQRAALEHVHPDPAAWPAVLAAGRLWERRSSDPDFGLLRAGTGAQRLATALVAPQTGPVDGLEPVTALALRRFLRAHAVVPELPVALSLHGTAAIWLEAAPGAGPEHARALARALVAQYVLWHGPTDALLAVVAPAVPGTGVGVGQVAAARRTSAAPRRRRAGADDHGAGRRRPAVVGGRARGPGPGHRSGRAAPARGRRRRGRPRLVGRGRRHDGAAGRGATRPAADARRGAPARRAGRAVLDGRGRRRRCRRQAGCLPGRRGHGAGPPARPVPARRCRPPGRCRSRPRACPSCSVSRGVRPAGHRRRPSEVDCACDRRRHAADRLRVPIGVDDAGVPVALDLKESAQGGSGPHGLCIGATGSGKSELLRTLVLGLVATHSSAELNLVLVDFKGGATFLGLGSLPHVSAVITNLADELHLVDRMADALAGEITRRQELLRAAGNLTGVAEYAAARRTARARPAPAAGAAGRRRRVLRAARPAPGARRPARARSGGSADRSGSTCCSRRSGSTRAGCAGSTRTCPTGSRCAPSPLPSRARCWGCPTPTSCRPRPARPSSPRGRVSWSGSGPRTSPARSPGRPVRAGARARRHRAGPTASGPGRWGSPTASGPPPEAQPDGAHGARHDDRGDGRARDRRRTGCGCPRWMRRHPSTRCSACPRSGPGRGLAVPVVRRDAAASPSAWSTGRTCNAATR